MGPAGHPDAEAQGARAAEAGPTGVDARGLQALRRTDRRAVPGISGSFSASAVAPTVRRQGPSALAARPALPPPLGAPPSRPLREQGYECAGAAGLLGQPPGQLFAGKEPIFGLVELGGCRVLGLHGHRVGQRLTPHYSLNRNLLASRYSSSNSIAIHCRPKRSATAPAVLEPANGSTTRSPSFVSSLMKNSGSAAGKRAG